MQQQDQSEKIEPVEKVETLAEDALVPDDAEQATDDEQNAEDASASTQVARGRFDWPALIAALALAAFFALTARFNSQPAPSYIPAAVFSATGCGLLVTAIRKLRARPGAGLREAALSGFGMALFQFAVAFTYPDVFTTVTTIPDYSRAFLLTWGLIALFAVVLSLAGATIGHLAFAPLRPLPARAQKRNNALDEEDEDEDEESLALSTETPKSAHTQQEALTEAEESADEENAEDTELAGTTDEDTAADAEQANATDEAVVDEEVDEAEEVPEDEERIEAVAATVQARRVLPNYLITVLLLGLLPMMAGYVFAAAYDFTMNAIHVSTISPALYPTLSLLSGLLPLRLAAPINLSGPNGSFIVFTLLWRIPDSVLGNPNLFDVQALESLVFTATGLALLLITMYGKTANATRQAAPWGIFLLLQALLGLILILPANLWLMRGLEGVLQFQNIFAQLPTIHLLNSILFVLNFVVGVLLSLILGLIVRRQYQLWSAPRVKTQSQTEELD